MAALTADAELDCKGLLCPLPAYRTRQALARLHPGQVLRVECTDPGSLADIPALARKSRWNLLSVAERDGVQMFVIQRPSLT
jgi:tRNA 2-thiouridine synthesizing protein A